MKKNTLQNGGAMTAAITSAEIIKLGLDVHADLLAVARIFDGQGPQPTQRFTYEKFLEWVNKQVSLAKQVYACYEAGPTGYWLQRKLSKLGVICYVVRPRDWDEYGSHVKTDDRDAQELALCLDRYVSGNKKAFSVVRVPTPEEEQARSQTRHRQNLQKVVQRLAQQGRGIVLYYGYRLPATDWWKAAPWTEAQTTLPEHLVKLLDGLRKVISVAEKELKEVTSEIERAATTSLPKGVGRLTAEVLEREVGDWARFNNRRQVASYTGLCPREDSSGPRRFQGHVNKHGNGRIRPWLIECMWRLIRFQPNYRGVKKWRPQLSDPKVTKARRKQIVAAMARQFAVDWWRIRTGRVEAAELGLLVQE